MIVEEQGGFRPNRGCPDQLFTLVEILKNRGKNGTYCCFIDVKKAFDRVFRAGLWSRIAEEGVKGKMWRVLVSIYQTVESCVKVKKEIRHWFPVSTGVRQGCILSPLLYALFINGLVKEIKALNKGVNKTSERKLSCLLYADNIVLASENRYALQEMLDVVSRYAKKWRFELNPKKSEVVVFGEKYPPKRSVEVGRKRDQTSYTIQVLRKRTHKEGASEGQKEHDPSSSYGCARRLHAHTLS